MDRILFVDDEENILSALKRELRPWAKERGVELETASSAKAALEILSERAASFALVVSDLRMPEMKGSDFLVEVKARWPSMLTMLLTGYSEIEEIMKAVKAGVFSYLLKPWDTDYLASELERALDTFNIKRENERYRTEIEEELRWAGEMQRALLRPNPLASEGVEFKSSWQPVPGLYCGGDYYDVVSLGAGKFLVLVGDVAGHGVRGALVTGILKAVIYSEYVRAAEGKRFSPAAFLSWLNERMNFELRKNADLLICFFAAVIDQKKMSICYANAGQPRPFIVRKNVPMELPAAGPAIGFENSVSYVEESLPLSAGDVLVVYTDGLIEIGKGKAPFNTPLKEILASQPYGPDYHKRIIGDALAGSGEPDFTDDLTLLTARIE